MAITSAVMHPAKTFAGNAALSAASEYFARKKLSVKPFSAVTTDAATRGREIRTIAPIPVSATAADFSPFFDIWL